MAFYSTDRLWDNEEQNVNVFNWNEILEEWNESLNMHHYVQTVIDNLKAVSDPDSEYDFPLSHFLKYLNWEKDGITWFLYEVVSMRWMWGESRLDFVKDLVKRPEIKLDEGFPVFPGSPKNIRTVRKFLTDSLSEDELEYLEMPLVSNRRSAAAAAAPVPVTPPRPVRVASAPAPAPAKPVKAVRKYSDINIFLQRPDKNGKGQPDDVIHIIKDSYFQHTITYKDGVEGSTQKIVDQDIYDVIAYVRNIVNLNRFDREGFQFIQLSCPGAPSVLLTQYLTAEERDLMYDALERTLKNWPVNVTV
jgi:hypothetical protein